MWISQGTKFQLKLTILTFWTKLTQKEYTYSKLEKSEQLMNSAYSKFLRYQTSDSMIKFAPKKVFPVKNRKIEQHHWILHIQISLGTKFELKLTILISWTKFAPKAYFQSKSGKMNTPLNSTYSNQSTYQISD